MAMVRWDPFSEMMTMQRDMNRLFSSLGMPLYTGRGDGERVEWMPTVDVIKQGDDLVVRAELPGVKPEDVEVTITDDVLTLRGTRKQEEEYREGDYLRKESTFGSFERQVMLPQGVDASRITADYGDGVLTISIPQAARNAQPHTQRVPISGTSRTGMSSGENRQTQIGGRSREQEVPVGTRMGSGMQGQGQQGGREQGR